MLKYVKLADDGKISITSEIPARVNGKIVSESFDFPDDFDFSQQHLYKIIDGELIKDVDAEYESLASEIRAKRDSLLSSCDWTQTLDAPLTSEEQLKWREYRQVLRDIPQQENFPYLVEYPTKPSEEE